MLLQYKLGSTRQGPGSAKYAVPDLKWVGLRPSQLDDLDLPLQVDFINQLKRGCRFCGFDPFSVESFSQGGQGLAVTMDNCSKNWLEFMLCS